MRESLERHRGPLVAVAVLLLPLLAIAGSWFLVDRDERSGGAPSADGSTSLTEPAASTTTLWSSTSTSATATTAGPTTTAPPPLPTVGTIVRRGDPTVRSVALTFDAGSDVGNTDVVLELLQREGITATFGITAAERAAQIRDAEAAIVAAAGRGTNGWFRPPYGDVDDGVVRDAAAAGWPVTLMWTVDSLGWKGTGADAVVDRRPAGAEPGAIYLLHVGAASDDAEALPRIIGGLRDLGYSFETAAEIAG
ncbi:polysaccharide deacetylase family protein [Actinomarinicola tropica]|uniref:NodB homology domain-containing protein n=1 Tax=Actinomarinicola tropica TaxID=2789776 RepID=A0A5Q2RNM5_9ACTN|nr:polysaccharide deacetylase family protein [Actinomarinicola tropica]QGG96026.1 hypothetical protein GH723_13475 [Actinomarinicola tropica]